MRFLIALAALGVAALATRALAGIVPDNLEMMLAGGLAILVPGWAMAGALALDEDRGPVTAWGLVPLLGVVVWAIPGGVGTAGGAAVRGGDRDRVLSPPLCAWPRGHRWAPRRWWTRSRSSCSVLWVRCSGGSGNRF